MPQDNPGTMSQIERLWRKLSEAMNTPRAGESILGCRATPPWESADQCVAMAWQDLTRPDNLNALLEWGTRDLNPHARECTDKAIAVCRSRSKSNGEPDT